jgi:glycosyltransferase involved in cell wall biosynthesis
MPDAWRPALFGMDQIIVPSEWCGQSTALPKPNQTLSIVPLGVGSQFTPTARKRGPKLKFLAFDTHADSMRAGMDIAMRAFGTAFPGRSDVRLDIWTTQPAAVSGTDIRIQLRGGVGPDRELLALYHEYDALIFASRGEGFGLVPLEAIASGMPVLHSGQTGMAGIADLGQLIGSRQMLAPSAVQEGAHWYEPIVDILAARLRQFDTQYDAWQNKALGDAQIVSERFTWRASALALLNAMEGNDAVSQSGELHQPRAV